MLGQFVANSGLVRLRSFTRSADWRSGPYAGCAIGPLGIREYVDAQGVSRALLRRYAAIPGRYRFTGIMSATSARSSMMALIIL